MSEANQRLYEETQRRLREVTTLYEASQVCLSISDQKGLLTAIIEAAARAADAALGSVMLIDEEKGQYVFGAHYGLSEGTIAAVEAELHIPLGEGLVGSVVTTGRPLVVADVTMDPRWIPTETKERIHSFLGVPLVGRDGRPLGALTLSRPEVGAFDEGHARLLSTFANQAALAIENAWLYEQAQARSRYLETLQKISATLHSTLPLDKVLTTITQGAGKALNYVGSLIVMPDARGERLTLGAVWGHRFLEAAIRLTGLEVGSFSLPLTARENPMVQAYLSGELQAWSRAPERIVVGVEPPINPKLAPVIERAMGARLAACIPLPVGEKVVGVLIVFSPREGLSDEERTVLLGLADQAGLAIENAWLYGQAQREITQRKRALEALRQSEERYRRLFEDSPISLWEEDFSAVKTHLDRLREEGVRDFRTYLEDHPEVVVQCAKMVKVIDINKATLELYQVESKDALRDDLTEAFAPESYDAFREELVAIAEGRTSFESDTITETLAGQKKYTILRWLVAPGHEETLSRVLISIIDITERKQAEEALRESEEKFRNLAEQSPNMIFINKKGRVVYANKKCEEIMGCKREEFYSPDFDFLTLIAPKYVDLIKANFSRHTEGEDVLPYEYALVTKEGKRIEAIITSKLIRYEGESAILGIVTDITERVRAEERIRESEEKFRHIFESVTDCLIYLDRSGRILEVNEKAVQVFGGSKEDLLGKHFTKLGVVSLKDMPMIVRGFASALAGGAPNVYVRIKNKKGQEIPLECTTALVRKDDRVAGAIVIARDVTERKRAEAERERLLTALEHRSTQLQTAAEVSKSASTILDPEELMNQTVNLIQERFDCYYVGLFLVDGAGGYAVLRAGTGKAGRQMLEAGHKLAVGGESMIGWSVANAQARIALDVGKEAMRFDNPYLPETRSEMVLPLISHGQCIGALTVQSAEEPAFSKEDIAALQTVADQLAIAVENARLFESERRQRQIAEMLLETSAAIASSLDLGQVLLTLASQLLKISGFHACALSEWDRERGQLYTLAEHVHIIWPPGSGEVYRLADYPITERVLTTGEPAVVYVGLADASETELAWMREEGLTALLIFPLRADEETIGLVEVGNTRPALASDQAALQHCQQTLQEAASWLVVPLSANSDVALLELARRLVEASGGTTCILSAWQPLEETIRTAVEYSSVVWPPDERPVYPDYPSLVRALEEDVAVVLQFSDPASHPADQGELARWGARTLVVQPLSARGKPIGLAELYHFAEERAVSDEELRLWRVVADQTAVAIENAGLYKQVQHHAAELEERVAERTAELTAVNKELEAFAYSVSHDLRAPLRSIDGFSQALLEDCADKLDAQGQDYLLRVRAASQRMGQLIDDLLNLSRVTRAEMRRETVNLSSLVQTIVAELQETQPDREVEFVVAEGLVAHGDAHLLWVVLENLLGNAWKFTSKHPQARIEFGVTQIEGKPAYFVRDDGVGFDMTYADKLFGAFQRLHSVAEFEGTGIGLATVQRIIHRHGGQVWAEGAVEQGATFYFTL